MQNKFFLTKKLNNSTNIYYFSVFLIMAFAAWLFWHGINGEFLFDDWQVLLQTDFVRNHSAWFAGYRPIRNLSYVIDLQFGNLTPFTFHVSNLIYHLINIVLVFNVLNILIRPALTVEKIWITGITAVFAIHPVQVESVVYISGRRDLLFTLFYLLGIIVFLKMICNPDIAAADIHRRDTVNDEKKVDRQRLKWAWTWVLVFTVLSTLSKEAGITLPVFCFILQQYFYGHWKEIRFRNAVVLFLFLTVLAFYSISMAMPSLSAGYMGGSFLTHIENCSCFLFKYIDIIFYPVNLAADYSDFSLKFIINPLSIKGIAAVSGVIFLTFFSLVTLFTADFNVADEISMDNMQESLNTYRQGLHDYSLFSVGWLWFLITILPMSNIVPHVERFALHYLYLPMTGIFIALWGVFSIAVSMAERVIGGKFLYSRFPASALDKHGVKWRRSDVYLKFYGIITGCVFFLFCLSLSVKTMNEIKWWQDDIIFWEHNTKVNPGCARANANLGTALLRAGKLKKAASVFKKTLAIKNLPQVFLGMANIAMDEKNYKRAEKFLEKVPANRVKLEKQRLFLLGMAALGQGKIKNAGVFSSTLCRKWPGFDGGFFLKGKIDMVRAEYDQAALSFKQAIDVSPFVQRNYVELIRVLVKNKKFESAMLYIEQGFNKKVWNKNNPYRLNDLGYVAELTGQDKKAMASYESAVNADHGCIIAALNLSRILCTKKKFNRLVSLAQKVVIPDSDLMSHKDKSVDMDTIEASKFMNNVGIAYIMLGRKDKGKAAFQRAVKLWRDNRMAVRNLGRVEKK